MMNGFSNVSTTLRRTGLRVCAGVLVVAGLTVSQLAFAAPHTLEQLMRDLSQHRSGKATFVEKKYIAILGKPVESSGELIFNPPSYLEKRTLKPKPETMVLNGETLTLVRNKTTHTVQLQYYPELIAFIESIRGTLAGDRKALEKVYQLRLEGTREQWTLHLTPFEAKMQEVIEKIKIGGVRDEVRTIEIFQTDHDRSLMTITKAQP